MHRWAKRRHLHDWRLLSTLGLDAVSSHSPSAPLILSKSHYNPTNPTASCHDSLLSGSPAFHIRIWNWAGAPPTSTLPSLRKLISLLSVCLFLIVAGKCIRGLAARAEGAGFGQVAGNSVTGHTGKGFFIGQWGPCLALVHSHVLVQKNTQRWRKITDGFLSNMISQLRLVGMEGKY